MNSGIRIIMRSGRRNFPMLNLTRIIHSTPSRHCPGILRDILDDYEYVINEEWTKTNAFGYEYTDTGYGDNVSPPRPVENLSAPYVYVSNIPYPCNKKDFIHHMSRAGEVKKVNLIRMKLSQRVHETVKRPKYGPIVKGIVQYHDMKSAANAMTNLHCTRYNGNIIWVREFHPREEYVEHDRQQEEDEREYESILDKR
jgi:RNA recognition motif-containing protein